jgi:cell division protein FtsI/penicillin-binding protein 2
VVAPPSPPPPPRIEVAELASAQQGPDGHLHLQRASAVQPTTLDGGLQAAVTTYLAKTALPYGAVVMIDPQSGKVLAMAETRDSQDPVGAIGHLTQPTVPAASVIKVVTAAALLESGIPPEHKACFHGGLHGLDASHLRERPGDRRCETLTEALARSSNAAIARFALRDLAPGKLKEVAEAFGFNRTLPGDVAALPSRFDDSGTPLDRAKAAAGFSGSSLSPLHAAWLAAVVASDGKLGKLTALDAPLVAGQVPNWRPAISERTAATLRQMMVQTTEAGTGRHAFAARAKVLRGVHVGGKTGSLSAPEGELFRHVTWFVGFAPAEKPRVAIAALAINGWKWKVKAPVLARDTLALWMERADRETAAAASALEIAGLDDSAASL